MSGTNDSETTGRDGDAAVSSGVATGRDHAAHTLTVKEVAVAFAAACVPRTVRSAFSVGASPTDTTRCGSKRSSMLRMVGGTSRPRALSGSSPRRRSETHGPSEGKPSLRRPLQLPGARRVREEVSYSRRRMLAGFESWRYSCATPWSLRESRTSCSARQRSARCI